MDHSQTVTSLTLSGHLSALPDDIICHVLSLLPLCDSARPRLLSPRWRYLTDYRSVLEFDVRNVLTFKEFEFSLIDSYLDESLDLSNFLKSVDKFLENRKDRKLSTLKVNFYLSNKQASHIDRWVERGINMGIKTLELELLPFQSEEDYVLSDKLLQCRKPFYLKHLRLNHCALTLSSDCITWISHLATVELSFVPLHQNDIECIMSGGLNLTSLSLRHCHNPVALAINVELPRLKKLTICGNFRLIELNCPNLKSFDYRNRVDCCKFLHVPLLEKLTLAVPSESNCSFMLDKLVRHVPNLQALSIYENSKVHVLPLPSNSTMSHLKWLSLVFTPPGSDLLSITYLLNASPFLEILSLRVLKEDFSDQNPQRKYINCPHFNLKKVEIQGFRPWNFIELARYLLNNAVALERMVITDFCGCSSTSVGSNYCFLRGEEMPYVTSYCFEEIAASYCSSRREEVATTLLANVQSNAELVFKPYGGLGGVVLKASNRMGQRVDLVYPDV